MRAQALAARMLLGQFVTLLNGHLVKIYAYALFSRICDFAEEL